MTAKKPKPVLAPEPPAACAMCGTRLSRASGPLMCPNVACPAFRGKP